MDRLCCLVRKYIAGKLWFEYVCISKRFSERSSIRLLFILICFNEIYNSLNVWEYLQWFAAVRGYALSYLSSSAGRIRFLLNTPGMVALDLDSTLKGLFQKIVEHLENIPKPQGENISAITCDLSVSNSFKSWNDIILVGLWWLQFVFILLSYIYKFILNSLSRIYARTGYQSWWLLPLPGHLLTFDIWRKQQCLLEKKACYLKGMLCTIGPGALYL